MLRERAVVAVVVLTLVLSCAAVLGGVLEVREQQHTIETLQATDAEEREYALSQHSDWGSAAYYSFHLTYDPPAPFAFAALGQRDSGAWKHRVRMLALEGQIYQRDAGNPMFALVGRFDFAFLVAFVLPLLLIALLHDLHASERSAGRHNLLTATAANPNALWWTRATVRALGVYLAVIIPLVIAAIATDTPLTTALIASAQVLLYVAFWTALVVYVAMWRQSAGAIMSALLGFWLLSAVVVPAVGRVSIDGLVNLPDSADLLLTQREVVNQAWDLPKEDTMTAFVERHPEWSEYTNITQPFEWKWYFAFQQVGDQEAESLSKAYRQGRIRRDHLSQYVALLSPPALMERSLQKLARTDIPASISYELEVRQFHAALRAYFYPKLFKDEPFDPQALSNLPAFVPQEALR